MIRVTSGLPEGLQGQGQGDRLRVCCSNPQTTGAEGQPQGGGGKRDKKFLGAQIGRTKYGRRPRSCSEAASKPVQVECVQPSTPRSGESHLTGALRGGGKQPVSSVSILSESDIIHLEMTKHWTELYYVLWKIDFRGEF